jgi:glyoxylase-like metal-dependent hydrolase (beta-lactamase superfamily II)
MHSPPAPTKSPQPVFETVFAFPPNRETLGGTAYLIVENNRNILVDCPAWNPINQNFIQQQGGVEWLVITHRGGIAQAANLQRAWNCRILVQEQEAYLLPELEVMTFHREVQVQDSVQLLWTPGHSPGSACLYDSRHGGVLFTGRHLLPNQQGQPVPLRIAKTFHWPRQLQSIQMLLERFSPDRLSFICPGANTGFLRGQRRIERAYDQLAQLDLEALRQTVPIF